MHDFYMYTILHNINVILIFLLRCHLIFNSFLQVYQQWSQLLVFPPPSQSQVPLLILSISTQPLKVSE
jgi:hypothetical protein